MANRRILAVGNSAINRSRYVLPVRLLVVLLVTMLSSSAWAQTGVVVELASEAPIPGAFVISMARAELPNPVQPMSTPCYGYAIARADANGRFQLPAPSQSAPLLSINERRQIKIYAPGYEVGWSRRRQDGTLLVRASHEPPYARLVHLLSLAPLGCVDKESLPIVTSLLERVHEEARALAKERNEIELAQSIHARLLRVQLGEEEFIRRRDRGELFK